MLRYVVRRVLSMLVVELGVVFLVFAALHLAPGDPIDVLVPMDVTGAAGKAQAAQLKVQLGLDKPLPVQFVHYVGQVATLHLGNSIIHSRPVAPELFSRLPATLELGLAALILALLFGIPAGILSALKRNSWLDNAVMFFALSGVSFPNFFLGTILILLFGLIWPILPPSGYAANASIFTWTGLQYLILPAITLATSIAATLARLTRSAMLDVLKEDYVRTARAKGVGPFKVVNKHAFRNSLIPVVTVLGIQIGFLLGGAVVVESVFSWPGVGRYLFEGLVSRDYPVVQATVLILSSVFVFTVFLTDLSYSLIDPRVRYA